MPTPTEDKSKILYDAVSKDYSLGTYEEFNTKLKDPSKRKAFYDGVGAEYNLGTYEEFEAKVSPVKKKDSTSPSQEQDLVSAPRQEDTSLATERNDTLTQNITGESFKQEPNTPETEQVDSGLANNVADLLERHSLARTNKPEDIDEVETQLKEERQGDFGFFGNLNDKLKSTPKILGAINPFYAPQNKGNKKEIQSVVKEIAKERNIPAEEVDINEAEEVFYNKRKETLLDEKADARVEEFIETLEPKEKQTLNKNFSIKGKDLSTQSYNQLLKGNKLVIRKKEIEQQINQIKENHPKGVGYTEEQIETNKALYQEYTSTIDQINETQDKLSDIDSDLLDVENEIDLYKRNYGKAINFVGKFASATSKMFGNITEFSDRMDITGGRLDDFLGTTESNKILKEAYFKNAEKIDNSLRKPKQLDNINTLEGFAEWALDLTAEQLPNTLVLAGSGGTLGLVATGASSSGAKFRELEQEEKQSGGTVNYTNFEKYTSALLSGVFESASEKISLGQLNKMKRVFKSADNVVLKRSVSKYLKDNAGDYFKDVLEEGGSEAVSQLSQNIVDKFFLGKEIELTEGLKDSFVSGAFMSGVVFKAPGLFPGVRKAFTPKDSNQILGENSEKITEINAQLDNENLSSVVREKLIEKRTQLVEDSDKVLSGIVKNVDELSPEQKQELIDINNQKYKLRKEYDAINRDSAIDDKTRKELLQDIGEKVEGLNTKKDDLLKPKKSTEKTETEASPLDSLTEEQKLKAKEQASKDIENEYKENGVTEYEITDKEITARAEELVKSENSNPTIDESQIVEDDISEPIDLDPNNTSNTDINEQEQETTQQETEPPLETSTPSTEVEQEKVESVKAELKNKKQELESILAEDAKTKEDTGQGSLNDRNAVVKELQDVNNKLNETQAEGNDTPNGEVRPTDSTSVSKQETEAVQPTPEPNTSEKPTERKLTNQENKRNDLVDLKNEYNRLSKAKKNRNVGRQLLQRINSESSSLGYYIKESGGKINIKNESGKNVGKITIKESLPEPTESDIQNAIVSINDGVTLYSGDGLSPRVDLGISRADVTKGTKDIKEGKYGTQPAKRLIQALKEARSQGGYNYIEGSGGNLINRYVPLSEVELDNFVPTKEEIDLINKQKLELEQEFNDWLENEQKNEQEKNGGNEKLVNREKSQGNVSNEKESKTSGGRTQKESKTKTDTRNTRGKDKPIDKTIDKSILPDVSKKGDTKTVKLSDNVEAKITTVEFFDGSPGYSVSIFKDGTIVEEKTGDTETEFSDNESNGVIKFVKNKQKGQKLLKAKQAKSKNNDSKTETKNKSNTDSKTEYKEKRVSFTVFGETFTGQQKSDGSIKSDQGTVYTKGMVSNVKDTTQKQVDNTTENSNRLSPITKKQFTRLVHRLNKAFPKVKVTANAKKFNETLQKLADNTDSQLKFLKNPTGVVYGFVNSKTGQIFINPDALNANTPIHEFAHIWVNALKGANRALFKKGLSLIDGTKYHRQVSENDAYSNLTDDQILEEALVTAIGDKGEAFVKDLTKSKFREFLDSVKKFLGDKFFINKKNKISKLTLDQFLDGSLSDLLGGKDLKNSPVSSDNFTNKEALEYVRSVNKKTDTQLENNDSTKQKIRKIVRKIIKAYSDRQFLPKKLLEEIGATYSKNLLINTKGASGRAKWFYEDAYDKIYRKLPDELRAKLDVLIQQKRIVAIETTRKEKGIDPKKKPIKHPGGQTLDSAQKAINGLKEELGDKVFNDLDNRANEYFKVFHKLLDLMKDNGLISQDSYDKMKNTDYQPRLFVQHILDYEGSVRLGDSSNDLSRSSSLAKEQVKNLEEGSENGLIRDSEYLLSTMINARMKAMATNTANREFITNEFPEAKKRYEALRKKRFDKKNWSREDKRFYDYFSELNKMVKDNPIVKKVKNKDQLVIDGMVPEYIVEHKYKKEPKGFKRAYYYENGIRKEFFLENDFHDQWFDNLQGFLNPNAKELISYASGSAILKGVATGANPAFVLTNTPRDFAFTILFSKEYSTNVLKGAVQLFKDTRVALKEIKKKEKGALGDNLLDKYIEYGGDMSFLSTQGKIKEGSMLSKQLNKIVGKRGKERAKYIFNKVTLAKINNYSELMFRVALFQRSINNELKAKGYKNVSEVTDSKVLDEIYTNSVSKARSLLDFNQGGSITKDLESVIPYINSAVQGTRVATDALSKDPAIVGFKLLQASVYASAVPIGMSIALLSAFKDDDDERTATEIYLDALDGVSAYQKQMYLNIVLPIKDNDGEHYVVKIAKAHVMTPVTSITDAIMEHKLNELSGRKKKDSKLIFDQALTAFNNNVLPIDFKDPISNFTRTPLIKSVMTYKTGHDFYRDQPLTFNSDKNHPEILDGARDKNVENFYKSIGKKYEMSPARLKGAVESLITSRSTNPYVNLIYGGAEAITSGDKSLKEIGSQLGKDILSTPVKRLSSTTSDFNRRVNKNRKFKDLEKEIYLKNTYKKYEAQELMVKYYKDEISGEEAIEKMESFDEVQKKQAKTKIRSLAKFEGISATAKTIFFTQDKELRAFRLLTSYGDLFDGSEENEEAIKELRKIKAIDKETFSHYNRMVKEFGK